MRLSMIVLLAGVITGCSDEAPTVTLAPAPAPSAETMAAWTRSCALCHVTGEAGAPRTGNPADWLPRLAKGRDVLLQHTIQGYNMMPPLGYCMSCEEADFISMIEFMSGAALSPASSEVTP